MLSDDQNRSIFYLPHEHAFEIDSVNNVEI